MFLSGYDHFLNNDLDEVAFSRWTSLWMDCRSILGEVADPGVSPVVALLEQTWPTLFKCNSIHEEHLQHSANMNKETDQKTIRKCSYYDSSSYLRKFFFHS